MTAPCAPVAPLFVPGHRPERFAKAAASGADAVIIDLEDAVGPERKAEARRATAAHGICDVPVMVRVNAADTPWFADDLAMLAGANVAAVMLPKAAGADAIGEVILRTGIGGVIPLVETAAGIATLDQLLACEGVLCAAFGSLDLALDLGCAPDWEPLLLARLELVLRSRIAGIAAPIDGVTPQIQNGADARRDAARARTLGFRGKLAIHPNQVAPIRAAFGTSAEERAWAEEVLAAVASQPCGAVRVAGAMVDLPVVERARRLVGLDLS